MLVGPGFTQKNVISCAKIKRLYRHINTLNPLFDFFFILDMDYLLISRPCFCRYFCLVNITDVRISRKNFLTSICKDCCIIAGTLRKSFIFRVEIFYDA